MTTDTASDYEKQRLENIQKNRDLLASLGLTPSARLGPAQTLKIKTKAKPPRPSTRRLPKQHTALSAPPPAPARRSKRLRGESAPAPTAAEASVVETGSPAAYLSSASEHFTPETLADSVLVDGHYSGWVESATMARLGIAATAAEAWESGGGGKFTYADPTGSGKKRKRTGVGGQSEAKHVASTMMLKNPNAYFYRHTEPGVDQWTGDWTEEERDVFVEVARKYGCGDKWGLFSTHIPHRVGYQCSNYYRQYVLPAGWVVDENYLFANDGKAIYVGKHKRLRK